MELSFTDLQIIKDLDDGSLYASPLLVQKLMSYPGLRNARLLVSYDSHDKPNGYLPVGQCYADHTLSYIAAMPNSPPVSPTYTPGAQFVLRDLRFPYFDTDLVSDYSIVQQYSTASAYGLSLENYLALLSPSRQKDIRRKLKQLAKLQISHGTLIDIARARPWLMQVWSTRHTPTQLLDQAAYARTTLAWLAAVQHSGRATLKIERYHLGNELLGINCCVLHYYRGRLHCDDYLTWYDPQKASGLGIASSVRNLTNPFFLGARYNLGNPGVGGVHPRHAYKFDVLPPEIRLTQAVFDTRKLYAIKKVAAF